MIRRAEDRSINRTGVKGVKGTTFGFNPALTFGFNSDVVRGIEREALSSCVNGAYFHF